MARGRASCEADARAKEERAAAKKAGVDEAYAPPDAADAAPTMQIHKDTPIPAGMGIPKIPASGGIIGIMTGVALAWGAGHETIRENGAYILKTLWRGWPTAATVRALAIDLPWVSPPLALPAHTSTIILWSEGGAGAYHVATTAAMALAMGFSLLTLAALGVWLGYLTASGGYGDLQPTSETRTGLCPEEEEDAAGVMTSTSWRVSDYCLFLRKDGNSTDAIITKVHPLDADGHGEVSILLADTRCEEVTSTDRVRPRDPQLTDAQSDGARTLGGVALLVLLLGVAGILLRAHGDGAAQAATAFLDIFGGDAEVYNAGTRAMLACGALGLGLAMLGDGWGDPGDCLSTKDAAVDKEARTGWVKGQRCVFQHHDGRTENATIDQVHSDKTVTIILSSTPSLPRRTQEGCVYPRDGTPINTRLAEGSARAANPQGGRKRRSRAPQRPEACTAAAAAGAVGVDGEEDAPPSEEKEGPPINRRRLGGGGGFEDCAEPLDVDALCPPTGESEESEDEPETPAASVDDSAKRLRHKALDEAATAASGVPTGDD